MVGTLNGCATTSEEVMLHSVVSESVMSESVMSESVMMAVLSMTMSVFLPKLLHHFLITSHKQESCIVCHDMTIATNWTFIVMSVSVRAMTMPWTMMGSMSVSMRAMMRSVSMVSWPMVVSKTTMSVPVTMSRMP